MLSASPSTAVQNTKYYHHMSSPKADYRSRKRSLEHRECDDSENEVQVVVVKKRRSNYNQGVLSTSYVSRGLDKIRTWFKDSPLNNFANSVLNALHFDQPIEDSSDSSDSENSMPFDREPVGLHDESRRHSQKQEHRSLEFSAVFKKNADNFVKVSQGHGRHTITAKISPQVHKSEVEVDVMTCSDAPSSKPKWPSDLKSPSNTLSRQQIHPTKASGPEIVDLTNVNLQELSESSACKASGNAAGDEPEVVLEIPRRKPTYLTPDIQFVRSVRSYPRPPCLREWSNGERIEPVKLFSRSYDNGHLFHRSYSQQNGSSLSRSSSFTTNQVMRIQEKEQYRMLLQHFSYGDHYQPVAKPSENRNAKTQVCAEKDIDPAFHKEILGQLPFSLCEKQKNKPCQLVKRSEYFKEKAKKKPEVPEEVILDDDDDEPVVLETRRTSSKPLPRQSGFFTEEWLRELKKMVAEETEERREIVEEQQKQIEEIKAKRAENLAERKRLQKIKLSKAVLLEGKDVEKEPLPEITPEMDAVIDKTLSVLDPAKILSKLNGVQVMRKDLDTLSDCNWLNDEVINFYIGLIVERSRQPGYPSVYAYNTYFCTSLRGKGYNAVKRWTRKVDIFSYDIILVPLHLGIHWCLATIDFRQKKIEFYDSMHGKDTHLKVLLDYLVNESLDKKKEEFDLTGWKLKSRKDIPPQLNGSDCGMFTLKYAEYISRDAPITFTQEHMPRFRRRMIYEIITKTII